MLIRHTPLKCLAKKEEKTYYEDYKGLDPKGQTIYWVSHNNWAASKMQKTPHDLKNDFDLLTFMGKKQC